MIYLWHHVATLALALAVGAVALRARWSLRHPGTALLLWHGIVVGAITAVLGALLTLGLMPYQQGILPALGELISGTIPTGFGPAHVTAIVAAAALAAAALAVQLGSTWLNRRQRARHRLLLDLVARPAPDRDALVVDHPATTAYHLPGRGRCIVLSTGALAALTPEQLDAVMAHERAHAREHHHLLLTPFHLLRQLTKSRFTRRVCDHVELLVEMRADDHAARHHGAATLAAALQRFHHAGNVPPGTLAMAGTATQTRIHRLEHGTRGANLLLRTVAIAVSLTIATTPLRLYLLPA